MTPRVQAVSLGLMNYCAAFITTCLGITVGNYTLNRPLIVPVLVGLTLGDVRGCIQIVVPTQITYTALVTSGGIVAADLHTVPYIGILLVWALAKSQGLDLSGSEASGSIGALGATVGTVGTIQFYGTAVMNLVWQHIGWARPDKKDSSIVGKVEVISPLISHLLISFISAMLTVYYGADAADQFKEALPTSSWHMKSLFTLGSLLPAVGIVILLKSVVNKATDLVFSSSGFTLAGPMYLTLIAATAVGAVFALINYQITMIRNRAAASPAGTDDDEKNI